jgi:thiamine biosynthesis lipoprotein
MSMGTELRVAAWTTDEPGAVEAFERLFAEFDRLEALMTTWRDTSDVSRVNAAAGQRAVAVSPEVREALAAARQISEWTHGKFDVTFGTLGDLWRFDQNQDNRIPDRDEIRRRVALIDYEDIAVDERAGTVGLRRPGMTINLGGIGKGYAVDRGVAILRERGLRDFMIQFGGDLYVAGRRGDRPWTIGLQDPRGAPDESFATIELSDETFSTSGDYERFFLQGDRRYHHILDPDTGEPARGTRSVTIVASRAILADGLSTGVFLLGPTEGLALIERLPEVEGVIVSATNEVLVSSGLRNRLTLLRPPTDAP